MNEDKKSKLPGILLPLGLWAFIIVVIITTIASWKDILASIPFWIIVGFLVGIGIIIGKKS